MTPALTRSSTPRLGVETEVIVLVVSDALDDDRAFFSAFRNDLAQRLFQSGFTWVNPICSSASPPFVTSIIKRLGCAHERDAPAGHDTFSRLRELRALRPRREPSSFISVSVARDLDHRHAAYQFSPNAPGAFLDRNRTMFFNLRPNRLDAAFDVGLLAAAFNDGRVVFVDSDLLGPARSDS